MGFRLMNSELQTVSLDYWEAATWFEVFNHLIYSAPLAQVPTLRDNYLREDLPFKK